MLFAAGLPSAPLRLAQNSVTLVGANSDSPKAIMFTVPVARKFTLLGLGTDQNAALVDLIAFHIIGTQAVALCDRQTNTLPTDERTVPMHEVFSVGESLTLGLRNRSGAGVTPALYIFYTDEPA